MSAGPTAVPFGAWPSPLSADEAALGGARFAGVALGGDASHPTLWWSAAEGGRNALFRARTGAPAERVEAVASARSRVNEYGGGAFWVHDDTVFWVEDDDQCVRRLDAHGRAPTTLTAPGPQLRAWRYAAGVVHPGGRWMVVEREVHAPGADGAAAEPVNDLGWLPTTAAAEGPVPGGDAAHRLVGGADFLAAPALSPDGSLLAWLRWDHPDMPWDAAELWAAELRDVDGVPRVVEARRVAGGRAGARPATGYPVAACLPAWSPEGRLHWCDDREDLWWLRCAAEPGLPPQGAGDTAAAVVAGGEVGAPRWVSGGSRFGFGPGRLVLVETVDGLDRIRVWHRDPHTGAVGAEVGRGDLPPELVEASWTDGLVVRGGTVAVVSGFPAWPTGVVRWGPRGVEVLHTTPWPVAEASISRPEPATFPTPRATVPAAPASGDRPVSPESAHGLFFPPRLEGVTGEPGELPPLVVRIHGGPTANARAELSPSVQFWTTRGFAVLEVNYRGSTGYGRAYRDRLRGGWGEVEVEDCIAGAADLVARGLVDPRRCVIRGGSSGGLTALEAVSAPPTATGFLFAAATTVYGVTDLMALAGDTHKFESRYLDGLVGPLPEAADRYRARSPLHHAERIAAPVLVLQGLDDPIVPPAQAEVLVAALEACGVDHEYRTYPGEGHGFRRPETLVDALGAELAFYRRVLGLPRGA